MLKKERLKQFQYTTVAFMLVTPLFGLLLTKHAAAAELTRRSIVVASPIAGVVTNHTYKFRVNTAITIGSIEVEYCTNSPFIGTSCDAPSGFSLTAASMGTQTGLTGFSIHPSSTTNKLILTRIPVAVTPVANTEITVEDITNPSTVHQTVFVRISTFASNNASGIRGDRGTVVYSTASGLAVGGYVPPYLKFCVGITVALDCSSTVGNYLNFGELSSTATRAVTSQFAVSTNDPTGYVATLSGLTLTSGNNVIPAINPSGPSRTGVSQFGLNLRANSNPGVGADKVGQGTATINPNYDVSNEFRFENGTITSGVKSTDFNVFTVSYIANISPTQPTGVYISTITYIATVSF